MAFAEVRPYKDPGTKRVIKGVFVIASCVGGGSMEVSADEANDILDGLLDLRNKDKLKD